MVNRRKEIIASAVTNLDLHDISRAARTYGVKAVYVVTPLTDQQEICRRIQRHWIEGWGAEFNPDRREALNLIRVAESLDAARKEIFRLEGAAPRTVATTARIAPDEMKKAIQVEALGKVLRRSDPWLLLFGTAWGLSESVIAESDYILEPITGPGDYNHLSVRCATAVILDRLFREPEPSL